MTARDTTMVTSRSRFAASLIRVCAGLGVALGILQSASAEPLRVEAASAFVQFEERIERAARSIQQQLQLRYLLAQEQQKALAEFVIGNMLFVAAHELGHALIADFELPVLGREEDAADNFAILTALKIGNEFSHRVLVEAAKGWFLTDQRDRKQRKAIVYYDDHGIDKQRAYQIVCLMVGSNTNKFKDLANDTKLPDDRQESCRRDYFVARHGWDSFLELHRRAGDEPKTAIEISYGDTKDELMFLAQFFRTTGFLEKIAEEAASMLAWSAPFTIEIAQCGEVDGYWSSSKRKLVLCYEMALEFAELYRDFVIRPPRDVTKRPF